MLSLTRPTGTAPMDGPAPDDGDDPLEPYDQWGHDLLYWLDRMVRSRHQLIERLALVFHDWFATSNEAVGSSRFMLDQTNLFRAHGLRNFKGMVRAITQDPAMILFLDQASNRKHAINENYARELMELFTLGADRGAYTEHGRARARALAQRLGLRLEQRARRPQLPLGRAGPLGPGLQDRVRQDRALDVGGRLPDGRRPPLHPSFFVAKLWSYFIPTPPDADTGGEARGALQGLGLRDPARCSRRS